MNGWFGDSLPTTYYQKRSNQLRHGDKQTGGRQSHDKENNNADRSHQSLRREIRAEAGTAKEIFTELADLASREVNKHGEFQLPGLGKLVRVERKAREGRNPATGETIKIAAKTTLKFRLGKAIKDSVIPAKKK